MGILIGFKKIFFFNDEVGKSFIKMKWKVNKWKWLDNTSKYKQ